MFGGGIGGSGGRQSDDPLDLSQPLVQLLEYLDAALAVRFEDTEAFVDDLFDEVLAMPPEARFRESVDVVQEYVEDRYGSIDAFDAQLPIGTEFAVQFLDRLLGAWIEEGAKAALEREADAQSHLVLLAALDVLRQLVELADPTANDDTQNEQLASSLIALYARIYREYERDRDGDRVRFSTFARDVARAEETVFEVEAPNAAVDLRAEEMTDGEAIGWARITGAAVVFDRLDVSEARGAELAGLSQEAFLEVLELRGVALGRGPSSVEELYSGPDLV